MARLPWIKFQDFYLRFGFLKVLAAVLDPHRRSAANEILVRRLTDLLFRPARDHEELWRQLIDQFPWALQAFGETESASRGQLRSGRPNVAEALLLTGDCRSQLYAITEKTAYKILDWGRNLRLIGAGNQISETGLVLRSLLPRERYEEFLKGAPSSWNPFVLSPKERLFFLFHLCQVDHLTLEVIDEVCARPEAKTIEALDAKAMTCKAFMRMLDGVAGRVSSADLPELRRARELASTMARELQLGDAKSMAVPRVPKPRKPPSPAAIGEKRSSRRTSKNADHQTIPRFEQLVDLGFIQKPCEDQADPRSRWDCRRHWRYQRLTACDGWWLERQHSREGQGPWEWRGFAGAALKAGLAGVAPRPADYGPETVAEFLWAGYVKVRRSIGHTPFHSIAMAAMIEAAASGFAIEMRSFHDLLMAVKKQGLLQEAVYFASGNEIDRMFVVIREGFVDRVRELAPKLSVVPS